jgi:hypothetical protein
MYYVQREGRTAERTNLAVKDREGLKFSAYLRDWNSY